MNRISFQWRITLMTAVLIAGACICLNLLLYRSGATGMDNLNGYVLQYQQNDDENLMIEIPDDQMSDFLIQFSQEVYDAKAVFGRRGWCITAAVTLLSAALAADKIGNRRAQQRYCCWARRLPILSAARLLSP